MGLYKDSCEKKKLIKYKGRSKSKRNRQMRSTSFDFIYSSVFKHKFISIYYLYLTMMVIVRD
jgi:hypothetical protein